jgi:hypothetical protein
LGRCGGRIIEAWRQAYNIGQPYSALGYLAPEEFGQLSPNGACGKKQAEPEGGTVLDVSSMQN